MKEDGIFPHEDLRGNIDANVGLAVAAEQAVNRPGKLNFPDITKYLPKKLARYITPTAMAVAAAVYGGAVCGEEDTPKTSDLQGRLKYSLILPFSPYETWWYTGGPHSDALSNGVKYAIDVTPAGVRRACPGSNPYMEKTVRAIANGEVTAVGNENDTADKFHSVVEIDHGEEFTSGYMHLDNILVEIGQYVEQGDALGYVSCESPPGGTTEGQHLHFYGELNGKPIEIDRIVMSGWTIEGAGTDYKGIMYQDQDDARTADRRRCGPGEESIKLCGGIIRNDIRWSNSDAELAPTVEMRPTMAPVPTLGPITVDPVSPPWESGLTSPPGGAVDRIRGLDPYNPSQREAWARLAEEESYNMAWEFINHLLSGTPADLEAAYNMQVPENLEFGRFNEVGLYSHKADLRILQRCSLEMDEGQTYDVNVNWPIPGGVPKRLTREMYLNYQQGYQRERFKILVGFVHNWTDAHGRRLGFKRFDLYTGAAEPYVIFEVVGNRVYIAEPRFCTYELSPLNN